MTSIGVLQLASSAKSYTGCPQHGYSYMEINAKELAREKNLHRKARNCGIYADNYCILLQHSRFSTVIATEGLFGAELQRGPLKRVDAELHACTFSIHMLRQSKGHRLLRRLPAIRWR